MRINYLGEGRSDEAIARKLIRLSGGVPGTSYNRPRSGTGKDNLDRRLAGLNAGAAYGGPVLVLRDKDGDADCAGDLVRSLLPERHPRMLLRVCVCSAEAWLMADVEAFARFCGLAARNVPTEPETCRRPKKMLLDWAAQGRAPKLRRHLDEARSRGVPDWASLGLWHSDFVETVWSPERVMTSAKAPSLDRAVRRLRELIRTA